MHTVLRCTAPAPFISVICWCFCNGWPARWAFASLVTLLDFDILLSWFWCLCYGQINSLSLSVFFFKLGHLHRLYPLWCPCNILAVVSVSSRFLSHCAVITLLNKQIEWIIDCYILSWISFHTTLQWLLSLSEYKCCFVFSTHFFLVIYLVNKVS